MKISVCIAVILFAPVVHKCFAQEIILLGGLSQQSMGDMKRFQSSIARQSPVSMKETQRFPSYAMFSAGMLFDVADKLKVGFRITGTSTGARSTYEDYSGQLTEDFKLWNVGVAGRTEWEFLRLRKSTFSLFGDVGYSYSKMNYIGRLRIGPNPDSETFDLHALNLVTNMGFIYKYSFDNHWFAAASAGYELDLPHTLSGEGQDSVYKADWSGLKLLAGIGFKIQAH